MSRVHHIALRVANIFEVTTFYRDVFELTAVRRSETSVWLRSGDAVLMIEARAPGEPVPPPESLELLCFAASAEEQEALRGRLDRMGVPIEASTDYTVYFRDPEGRRVGSSTYPLFGDDA